MGDWPVFRGGVESCEVMGHRDAVGPPSCPGVESCESGGGGQERPPGTGSRPALLLETGHQQLRLSGLAGTLAALQGYEYHGLQVNAAARAARDAAGRNGAGPPAQAAPVTSFDITLSPGANLI